MAAVLACRQQAAFLNDLAVWSQFKQAPGIALADEGVAVGQPLAGVDFAAGFVVEHDHLLARDFLHAVAGVEQQALTVHSNVTAAASSIRRWLLRLLLG